MKDVAEANIIDFQSLKSKVSSHLEVVHEKLDLIKKIIEENVKDDKKQSGLLMQDASGYLKHLCLPKAEFDEMLGRDETHWKDKL